jgi:hypothetical protein
VLFITLADASLLSRYLTVINHVVCVPLRDGSQPLEVVKTLKEDFDSVVEYAEIDGKIERSSSPLYRQYEALVRLQQDVLVSYYCQDPDKSWKQSLTAEDLMNVGKVKISSLLN